MDDRAGDAFQNGEVLQQGRAAVAGNDFVDRAAEVEVEEIRLHPVAHHAGGFTEVFRVSPEELDTQGPLAGSKIEVFHCPGVLAEDTLGGDKLRDHDVGSLFFAKPAKNLIRHPRHRRKVEGKGVLEPGKH